MHKYVYLALKNNAMFIKIISSHWDFNFHLPLPLRDGPCSTSWHAQHRFPAHDDHWHFHSYCKDQRWLGLAHKFKPRCSTCNHQFPFSTPTPSLSGQGPAAKNLWHYWYQSWVWRFGLVAASDEAKSVQHPGRTCWRRGRIGMVIMIPFFQRLTGMNIIMFYAQVLIKNIGFGDEASLMSSIITSLLNLFATFISIGTVDTFATFISIATVDKFGGRFISLKGGIQMSSFSYIQMSSFITCISSKFACVCAQLCTSSP